MIRHVGNKPTRQTNIFAEGNQNRAQQVLSDTGYGGVRCRSQTDRKFFFPA